MTFENCLLVSVLHGLSFRRATLDGLDFQGADLTEVDFREAVLVRCNLRNANVTDARFEGADLGNMRLADATRFKGVIISKQQAAALLDGLGLRIV